MRRNTLSCQPSNGVLLAPNVADPVFVILQLLC